MVLFDAEGPLDVAMLHMTEPPRPPRELRPEIGPELEAVILKALAKEPKDRYPSGAALADALDQALQTLEATPSSPASVSRLAISERVVAELTEQPPLPIPAAVATSASQPVEPQPAPKPTTPLPAQTTAPESTSPPAPVTSPGPATPLASKRLILYAGVGVGIILVILLLIAVFLLLRGSSRGKESIEDQILKIEVASQTIADTRGELSGPQGLSNWEYQFFSLS